MRFIVVPLGVLILILAGGIGFFNLKIDIETIHLIPLILIILILLFSIYQQKTFRRTEQTFQQIEERLRDQLLKSLQEQTLISPFNYRQNGGETIRGYIGM